MIAANSPFALRIKAPGQTIYAAPWGSAHDSYVYTCVIMRIVYMSASLLKLRVRIICQSVSNENLVSVPLHA